MSHGTQKKESYQSSRTHGHDMHRAHAQSKSPPSSPHSTPPSPRTSRANATIRKNAQSHRHVPRRRSREGGEWEGGSLYCRDHPAREKPGRNPQNVSLLLNWLPWGKDECTNQRCAANLNLKFEFAPSPFEICIADLCLYHVPWRSTTLIQVSIYRCKRMTTCRLLILSHSPETTQICGELWSRDTSSVVGLAYKALRLAVLQCVAGPKKYVSHTDPVAFSRNDSNLW